MLFLPSHAQVGSFTIKPNADLIEREPMLFTADVTFAYQHGGPLTRDFLDQLPPAGGVYYHRDQWLIDTRVTMLKPGWMPCIGGWHLDHTRRGKDGKLLPDHLADADSQIDNFAGVLDLGTGSVTQYLNKNFEVANDDPHTGFGELSKRIDGVLERYYRRDLPGEPVTTYDSGAIVRFNGFHRGTPATGSGWRFWIRASLTTWHRQVENKIRRQVNVYVAAHDAGW